MICQKYCFSDRLEPFLRPSGSGNSCLPKWYLRLSEFQPIRVWKIEDPFRRCSVQKQNTPVMSIIKIPYFLNRLADRVVWVMVRKLVELPKFLVFNSGTNSFGNSSIFTFYLLWFALYRFLYLLFIMGFVAFLCLRFRWSWMITPTSTSPRTGHYVPWASLARGSRECYITHSSVLATMGTL
jgi:hypothetical protein